MVTLKTLNKSIASHSPNLNGWDFTLVPVGLCLAADLFSFMWVTQ